MSWSELEAGAPRLARAGRECLECVGLALLGTIREDGWPRISPVEAHVTGSRLVIGVMPRSLKVRDLARDPRCTLQSVVADPNSGEPELKLYARAVGARDAPPGAWWTGRPANDVLVFSLDIEQAALVEWNLARGEMTVTSWSRRGLRTTSRPYP